MNLFLQHLQTEIKVVLVDHGEAIFLPDEVLTETESKDKRWLILCSNLTQRHKPKTSYFRRRTREDDRSIF